MLLSTEIYQTIVNGSGFFQHGHTYLAHATACAAALAVQQEIHDNNLIDNVNRMGEQLQNALLSHFKDHPNVGDIRGRGLFWGIELVADRITKTPLTEKIQIHAAIKKAAMDEGLICYPGSGTIDGKQGNHVLLAPSFIINEQHVTEIVEKLGRAIDRALVEKGVKIQSDSVTIDKQSVTNTVTKLDIETDRISVAKGISA